MSVRARNRQAELDRHLDQGIKANNENLLALEVRLEKLAEAVELVIEVVEALEARKWWWPF